MWIKHYPSGADVRHPPFEILVLICLVVVNGPDSLPQICKAGQLIFYGGD